VLLSVKGFVLDVGGRLLLLDCADPARPGVRWWELPGGGVEPGEDEVDRALGTAASVGPR